MFTIIAGDPLMGTVLAVGVLAVAVVAVVGLTRGRGIRPALWTVLTISVVMIGMLTLGSVVTGRFVGEPGVSLVPFQEIERGLRNRHTNAWTNVVGNIAMFVPLGFAIACLARGKFWARWWLATACGLALSTTIEITQYAFGRVADVDDIILNTGGAVVGGLVGTVVAASVIRARRPPLDARSSA